MSLLRVLLAIFFPPLVVILEMKFLTSSPLFRDKSQRFDYELFICFASPDLGDATLFFSTFATCL